MDMRKARIVRLAAVLSTLCVLAACSNAGTTTSGGGGNIIKIGIDLPLSGADASDGVPTEYGAKLAVMDANKAKMVPGFTLEVNVLDDSVNGVHDPAQGAKNIQAFAADAAVLAVVGPFNSNVAKAEIPLSNSLGIALISPANTNPTLTKGPIALGLRKDNPDKITYFRVCTTDDIQGPASATYEYQTLGKRMAYVIDDNETYGKGVADEWAQKFTSLGGKVLGHDHITKAQQDFHALLTRAAGLKPDIVFYGGTTSTGGGLVRKQMAASGLGSVVYGGADGIRDTEFLKIAGSGADNVFATVASVNAAKLPAAQAFLKRYQAEYKAPVGSYSANGYVSAMVVIHAIAEASKANGGKMPTREEVLDQLRKTKDFNSIIGTFSFDQSGDTTNKIISIYQAKKGSWNFIAQQNFGNIK